MPGESLVEIRCHHPIEVLKYHLLDHLLMHPDQDPGKVVILQKYDFILLAKLYIYIYIFISICEDQSVYFCQ